MKIHAEYASPEKEKILKGFGYDMFDSAFAIVINNKRKGFVVFHNPDMLADVFVGNKQVRQRVDVPERSGEQAVLLFLETLGKSTRTRKYKGSWMPCVTAQEGDRFIYKGWLVKAGMEEKGVLVFRPVRKVE